MKKLVLTVLFVFAVSSIAMAAPLMDYSKGKATLDYTYRPNLDFKSAIGFEGTVYDETVSGKTESATFDGKTSLDWGITLGMGNDFAFQYKGYNAKANLFTAQPREALETAAISQSRGCTPPWKMHVSPYGNVNSLDAKVTSQEFNILYKVNKNVSAFTGIVRASAGVAIDGNGGVHIGTVGDRDYLNAELGFSGDLKGPEKNMWQLGLVGSTKVADKTTAYGVVALGNDYRNWEAGLSYAISKDVDFNVSYRATKFDKLKLFDGSVYYDHSYGQYFEAAGEVSARDVELKGFGFGLTYKF